MTQYDFNRFWEISFQPKLYFIIENFAYVRFDEHKKDMIWIEYEKLKTEFKSYKSDPEGRIDRHKIAAVMCIAILNIKPFEVIYNGKRDIQSYEFLANEVFALHCAFAIINAFIISKAIKNNDKPTIEIFKDQSFIVPPCSESTYEMHLFICLYYMKQNKSSDFLALSSIFFFIEEYTRVCRSNKMTPPSP